LTAFEQENAAGYETPMARLQGMLAIAQVWPYAPGQVFGLRAEMVRRELTQAHRVQAFMDYRRQTGQLSEQEELSLTQQISGLQVAGMQGIADIAEGGPNLLPGIAATGAFGAGLRRFTSLQQASLFVGKYGSPRRSYGAFNGGQAQMQRNFYDSFDIPTGPYSRSAGVNNGLGGEATNILRQILNELQRQNGQGKGSSQRPQFGSGNLDNGRFGGGGNNAPFN
jgi:hypothetical protein